MHRSEWGVEAATDKQERDPAWPEERADRYGIMTALVLLCLAFFVAAMFVSSSTFEKCTAVENASERYACYDKLKDDLSKPPAKGAEIPKWRLAR